jgi:hypothetical protein
MDNYTRVSTDTNGDTCYYNSKDELHRTDGPAVIYSDGFEAYFINDVRHRLDGPAVIYGNGVVRYWINGVQLSKKQYDEHPLVIKHMIEQHLLNNT